MKEDSDMDWRKPLIKYLQVLGSVTSQKTQRQALKYTLLDDDLYQRTIDGLLLKCLDWEQARVAMGEVH
jgi:hypothetical protein